MIDHIWRERLGLADRLVRLGPQRRLGFMVACTLERAAPRLPGAEAGARSRERDRSRNTRDRRRSPIVIAVIPARNAKSPFRRLRLRISRSRQGPAASAVGKPGREQMLQQSPARAAPDIDWRLLAPLLANAVMVHTVIGIIRVTTSYRTIELGLPVVWLGVISAGFALLPVFSAVALGRFIDRGNDSQAAWIGAALVLISAAGFWAWSASGAASARLHGRARLRSHVLHGVASDAGGAVRQHARTRGGVRPLHGGGLDRTGARALHRGMARRFPPTVPATGYLFGIGLIAAVLFLAVALRCGRRRGRRRTAPAARWSRSARCFGCPEWPRCSWRAW